MRLVKRIYRNMWIMVVISIIIFTIFMIGIFYNVFIDKMKIDVKNKAEILSETLNLTPVNVSYLKAVGNQDDFRITYMANNGDVLFDNMANVSYMDNHKDREEFTNALLYGEYSIMRHSPTLGKETFYYSVLLDDESVIRVAQTTDSIFSLFEKIILPTILIIIGVMVLCHFLSHKLSENIIKPINEIDLDKDDLLIYDELAPFARKIKNQKSEINNKISDINERANTIKIITDNMKEGLILINKKGDILSANNAVKEIFDNREIIGKNILLINRDVKFINKVNQGLLGESKELSIVSNDRNYNIYINPCINDNQVTGVIILFFDTTEKQKGEKQRKEFTANVSHELKTPITSILALSEMIENNMVKSEDIKQFANKISEQTRRLITLIEDIIRLSELDESEWELEKEHFDIYMLIKDNISALNMALSQKNIKLSFNGKSTYLYANKSMIEEVIINLIDNAIKYNKDDGEITIDLAVDVDNISLSFTDTGIGIGAKHLDRIFERFYRVDKSRSKKTGGTGLGLSIVKHIVKLHKGKVLVDSKEGEGTTLTCILPLKN